MLKQELSKFIRKKAFYGFWRGLYSMSLYGMNMGPASGHTDYSGERWIIDHVRSRIERPDPVVFDVGANVGEYASAILEAFGEGKVTLYCFEPSPGTFEILSGNLRQGGDSRLFNLGFNDSTGSALLYSNEKGEGATSVFSTHLHMTEGGAQAEEICLTTLDLFCHEHGIEKIDFLKMDVEGCEFNILKGGSRMIETGGIDFIQFEFAFPNISSRVFFRDIYSFLEDRYHIYRCLMDGMVPIRRYDYYDEIFVTQNFLAVSKGLSADR